MARKAAVEKAAAPVQAEEVKAEVKAEVKPEVKAEVKAEVKPEEKKAEAKPAAKRASVKKAAEKKTAAKKAPAKKAAEKKTTAKKASAKKAAEAKTEVYVQFGGKSLSQADLVKMAQDVWQFDMNMKAEDFKSVEIYVKPEENMAYFVVNGKFQGSFAL